MKFGIFYEHRLPRARAWVNDVLAGRIALEEIDVSPEHMPRPERRPIA